MSRTCSLVRMADCSGSLQVTHYHVYMMELLDGANCTTSSFRNSSISTDGACSRQHFGTSSVGVANLKLSWQAAHVRKASTSGKCSHISANHRTCKDSACRHSLGQLLLLCHLHSINIGGADHPHHPLDLCTSDEVPFFAQTGHVSGS